LGDVHIEGRCPTRERDSGTLASNYNTCEGCRRRLSAEDDRAERSAHDKRRSIQRTEAAVSDALTLHTVCLRCSTFDAVAPGEVFRSRDEVPSQALQDTSHRLLSIMNGQ
jgi:hypothetical protein